MDVIAYDPFLKKEQIEETGAKAAESVSQCDFYKSLIGTCISYRISRYVRVKIST